MRSKILYSFLVLGVAVFIGVFPSVGLPYDFEHAAQFYDDCIVKEISKCQSKVIFLTSSSDNLREYALLETKKAAFYSKEKDRLIKEMMEQKAEFKDYQVQYYINKRFKELNK